jgi:hypothetical protein
MFFCLHVSAVKRFHLNSLSGLSPDFLDSLRSNGLRAMARNSLDLYRAGR